MKKKHFFFLAPFFLLFPFRGVAQVTFTNGDHAFQIGGNIIAGYNYRLYPAGTTDFHKNTFVLDQARFDFRARYGPNVKFKIEMDLADLVADIQTPATAIGFLKDAYIDYHTKIFTIRAGYQKVRYGFNAVVSEVDDPFLQRPTIASKINPRRDLGITLTHWFPMLRFTAIGGIYSGMGEQVFDVNNTNGKPEYFGRIEYSYPARNIEEILDMHDSPFLCFQIGLNAKYKEGTITTVDSYDLLTVNGKKTSYGFDASLMYHGLSLQVESHQLRIVPKDSILLYSEGKQYTYFKAGGYLVELNYYCKKMKSVFAVRYDELNPNDLVFANTQRTVAYCYDYFIRQNYLCIKVQYKEHFNYPSGARWKDDEIRAGIQLLF